MTQRWSFPRDDLRGSGTSFDGDLWPSGVPMIKYGFKLLYSGASKALVSVTVLVPLGAHLWVKIALKQLY